MSTSNSSNEFLAALPGFINEAQEQCDAMEALLLTLESDPGDTETLNSLFRCAHTVKGSAGIFGLDRVVDFTHHVEALLDHMRSGSVRLNRAISTLLLQCNDEIRFLVGMGFDEAADSAQRLQQRAELVAGLRALNPSSESAIAETAPSAAPEQATQSWRISAQFGEDTFRNGMDPVSVCAYLQTLGRTLSVQWRLERLPALDALVHDSCYTDFVLELESSASQAELEDGFSFVADDCSYEVSLLAPQNAAGVDLDKALRAIDDIPDVPRLGDMLMSAGALSHDALGTVLRTQTELPAQSSGKQRLGSLLVEQAGVPPELVDAALGKQQKMRERLGADENRFIRVQAERLDKVINLLGELVIAGAGAGAVLGALEGADPATLQSLVESLTEANHGMNRLIEEIRNSTLGLRMVPVGDTFTRFKRVVRDTAASLGKEVQFDIFGAETELDKSMVEKVADPLMHLVRNALDHGLETTAERIAAGKPAQGRLTLSASHEAGVIRLRIEDDGRGINRDKVLARAWERGLVEKGVVPSDDAINMLIFAPGFSTADQVTNLSGRGVGMDVVRSNIEALRGTLQLNSQAGRGLAVDIRLPLTLAIIDGFMVAVGQSKFVLPLDSVVEVIAGDGETNTDDAGRHCVELRGAILPVVQLQTLYALESDATAQPSIVVLQSSFGQFGVAVDTLLGQNQTVIKPLGRLFRTLRGISGSAILGSGEVALIVDVSALGQLAMERAPSAYRGQRNTRVRTVTDTEEPEQNTLGETA